MKNSRSTAAHAAPEFTRRRLLRGAGGIAGLAGLGAVGLLSGCADRPSPAGAPSGGTPVPGGTLRVVFAGTSATADVLDPHVVGHSAGGALSKAVWDHLVDYNNDLTLDYRLAESLEPNADGSQWRMALRRGVAFSDGSPFTSRDVMWSLERMLDEVKPSAGDLDIIDLSRTRPDGDHAVVVSMREPVADFGSVLAGWYVYVIKDGTSEFTPSSLPVGTGPFVLESWSPGDRSVLTRNENHWDQRPHLDGLEILQVAEADARFNAFGSQEADVVYELSPAQGNILRSQSDVYLVTPPVGTMSSFTMRTDLAPFDDPRVREALKLSVDRQAMVDKVYYGFAEVGNDLYGKGAPFYADMPQRAYDPERARRLLREAGKENLVVTLHTADVSPGQLASATLFAEQAKAAGITVNLAVEPGDTYFSQVVGSKPFTQSGWWNYSLDYFYGQTLTSDAPANATAWRRPAWDATFAQARAEMDPDRRGELYREMQDELWNDSGYLIHSFALQPTGVRNTVQGITDGVPGTGQWASFTGTWLQQR
ncbi:ABC transporter substrate-binding protein [Gordonia terrae]|uniref:ABC transporter substrate-binding protein n=1 Tax=Gordonia terrae TaxID=2055 RepID=A0A2I1R8H1_9ACTN|nr:ABC transporter substrate-binding protein [Gordonia terrae]PKZ65432.1 ABC transporter substrate-binding protein [Gordonia terrae]